MSDSRVAAPSGTNTQAGESTQGEHPALRHRKAPTASKSLSQLPIGSPGSAGRLRAVDGLPEKLLTVREVAETLSVCRATVYALCERGELPHVRIANAVRVSRLDLVAFVAARHG